jgi:hypothetical protein
MYTFLYVDVRTSQEKHCRPPRPVTDIALLFTFSFIRTVIDVFVKKHLTFRLP